MEDLKLSKTESVFYSLIPTFLSPIASLAAGTTSDCIGRRHALLLSLLSFFFGSLLTSLAPNTVVFFSGCVLLSAAVGYAHTVTPVYTTELSLGSTRGFLTSFVDAFENVGGATRERDSLRQLRTLSASELASPVWNRSRPFFFVACSGWVDPSRVSELGRFSFSLAWHQLRGSIFIN